MNKGICVAGTMNVDILYPLETWPRCGELAHIQEGIERTTGGAVCNVAVDLAKLDPSLKICAVGRNGADSDGEIIMNLFQSHGIDTSGVICEGTSAFTVVMHDRQSGERTLFPYSGANGRFDVDDVDWSKLDADLFHVGYILLLPALDQPDAEYGTRMARLLCRAREHGMRTSIDVVSEAGDRFLQLVPPALKYADYCIINELEAQQVSGIALRTDEGVLIRKNMPEALQALKALGVSTWAVIHSPEGAFGLDEANHYEAAESLHLPEGYIQGSVGAGDAFCAGVLCGVERDVPLRDALEYGIAAAACSLGRPGSTEGVRTLDEAMRFAGKMRSKA